MQGKVIGMSDPTGIIVNYRIAYTKEVVVQIPGINHKKEARKFIRKRAVWKDEKGNVYRGVVADIHGSAGALRIKFKNPLPAKALGKPVEIAE